METKKRALGRGLEELFNSDNLDLERMESQIYESATKEEIVEIPISELRVNPYQPRKYFNDEALAELAASIKEHGVFQPIIVKQSIKGYEIVAGERRFRASKMAGLEKIPAIIRAFTDEQMMEIAVLENLQRENLNPIEEAEAYKNLMQTLNLNQEQLAKKVGKSRSHITNILGILNLPESIKDLIITNKITMGHARVLSKLEDKEKIETLAAKTITDNLSVRQLEQLSSNNSEYERKNKITKQHKEKSSEYIDLEKQLSEYFGTRVKLNNKKMEISYENDNDLNRILEIMNYISRW